MWEFTITQPLRVDVAVAVGSLRIEAGPPGRATVEMTPTGRAGQQLIDDADVDLRTDGDGHERLTVKVPRSGWLGGLRAFASVSGPGGVDVVLRCPEDIELDVRTGAADITAELPVAVASVAGASGDVRLGSSRGAVSVRTASGDVSIGRVDGPLKVDTASGELRSGPVAGPARVRSASGDVFLAATGSDTRVTSASGDIRLGRIDRGHVEVSATAGDVFIDVAPSRTLDLDIKSLTGGVHSELRLDEGGSSSGRSDIALKVRTTSGDVHLGRASARDGDAAQPRRDSGMTII